MPDSTKKTWKDVVESAPTGTITQFLDGVRRDGVVASIHIDEVENFAQINLESSPSRTSWLTRTPQFFSGTKIPLSVEFSESGVGTDEHRFTARCGAQGRITIYVKKRLNE